MPRRGDLGLNEALEGDSLGEQSLEAERVMEQTRMESRSKGRFERMKQRLRSRGARREGAGIMSRKAVQERRSEPLDEASSLIGTV